LTRSRPTRPWKPLLHAFVPHKFVDHTHATAVLSLIDQTESEALCAETFGDRLGFVPYVMPGFALAKKAAQVFEKNPPSKGSFSTSTAYSHSAMMRARPTSE
jgi:rhamnose utilization protein RhaD (predicted bifunctional aldolase and dehydrogenase)